MVPVSDTCREFMYVCIEKVYGKISINFYCKHKTSLKNKVFNKNKNNFKILKKC